MGQSHEATPVLGDWRIGRESPEAVMKWLWWGCSAGRRQLWAPPVPGGGGSLGRGQGGRPAAAQGSAAPLEPTRPVRSSSASYACSETSYGSEGKDREGGVRDAAFTVPFELSPITKGVKAINMVTMAEMSCAFSECVPVLTCLSERWSLLQSSALSCVPR